MSEAGEVSSGSVYAERIGYSTLGLTVLVLGVLGVAACTVVVFAVDASLLSRVLISLILVLLVLTFANFWKLDFEVGEKEVSFGFGLIKKRFPRSSVVSCEPYELTFNNYLGYGIRLGKDGTVAYNTRNGKGVKIVFEGGKRPYVVSVDDPERICALLAPGSRRQP